MSTMTRHGSAIVATPSDTEILITRTFDAPAATIFDAWTTPEHVRKWWGTEDAPLVVCDIDLRVGGTWRYVVAYPDGNQLGWHGTYRDIQRPNGLVSTEVWEPFPEGEAVNTMTLSEEDGTTTMTVRVQHSSKENRDGHLNSGMEAGMQVVLDRLEDLVRSGPTVD